MTMYAMVDENDWYVGRVTLDHLPQGPDTYHEVTDTPALTGGSPTIRLKWNGGNPIYVETASLADVKAAKLAELSEAFTQRIAVIRAGYPDDEITSWPEQKVEATAFTADPSASVPLLSHMASARGITVADLASRVLANASAWATMSGGLIGKRQKYEDAVNAAADAASVASIAWVD